jgi:D-hydroxyproline dehydrogenase subunit beta
MAALLLVVHSGFMRSFLGYQQATAGRTSTKTTSFTVHSDARFRSVSSTAQPEQTVDLVVVGAGIVGLAHAWHATKQGLSVVVLERDAWAVGASIRNFGHVCATAQSGLALEFALAAREAWLDVADATGVQIKQAGTVVLARTDAEVSVLEAFAAERGSDQASMLTAFEGADRLGFAAPGVRAAAHLPLDLRLDAPTTIPALAAHLAEQGVDFRFGENVQGIENGVVRTSRGSVRGERIIIAVGHDVDRFYPDVAADIELQRCRLRMLEIDAPGGFRMDPALLTGLSMLRYDGFALLPEAEAVRAETRAARPELLDQVVNLMSTQRPDGRLILGDTHHYAVTETPFEDESSDELLLAEFRRLFGAEHLAVRRRWRGVYASSARTPFLVAEPEPGVTVVSVTSGIGMTTSLGLAAAVLAGRSVPVPF